MSGATNIAHVGDFATPVRRAKAIMLWRRVEGLRRPYLGRFLADPGGDLVET